jgi:hypothetical protein
VFAFFYFVSKSDMSFLQSMAALGFSFVIFYFMIFFRAEADRDYLRAKELWRERSRTRRRNEVGD